MEIQMNREQIVEMAKEAGAYRYKNRHFPDSPTFTFSLDRLEEFAALVAIAERKECAKACDAMAETYLEGYAEDGSLYVAAKECSAAVRARGSA
jgi:hypothetical protein